MDTYTNLNELLSNEDYWTQETNYMPSMIVYEYECLLALLKNNDLYGTLLKIKDVYESACRVPILMALVMIEAERKDTTDNNDDRFDSGYRSVMRALVEQPITMGDLYKIAKAILKNKESFVFLPNELISILEQTRKLYDKKIAGDYSGIVHWRNSEIGHGSLRFADDDKYYVELVDILKHLKGYFELVNQDYKTVYLSFNDTVLQGSNFVREGGELKLTYGEKPYLVSEYFSLYDERYHCFDSFYPRKNELKYRVLFDGIEKKVRNQFFSDIYERYVHRKLGEKSVNPDFISSEEERALECLNNPIDYIESNKLINRIEDTLELIERGVILVLMERGTGKTALTSRLDGMYHSSTLIDGSFVRCYHMFNASLRGIEDFYYSVSNSFCHNSDGNYLRGGAQRLPELSPKTESPSDDMAAFLNAYHSIYGRDYTMLVIDGIDEMTEETCSLLNSIPSKELLDKGVFVLLMSRFPDEETVSSLSRSCIQSAKQKADKSIEIRRDDEINVKLLKSYIKNAGVEESLFEQLVDACDKRILYLKALLAVRDIGSLTVDNEQVFIESYINRVLRGYGSRQKQKILRLLVAIALFPDMTLNEYTDYLDAQEITYEFIGLLNDLMPILTVTRRDGENRYRLSDKAFEDYVKDTYSNVVEEIFVDFFNDLKVYRYAENDGLNFRVDIVIKIWNYIKSCDCFEYCFFDNIKDIVELIVTARHWGLTDYSSYMIDGLLSCLSETLIYGIRKDIKIDSLSKWLMDVNSGLLALEDDIGTVWGKDYKVSDKVLLHFYSDNKTRECIYDYIVDNGGCDNLKMWVWVFDVDRITDDAIRLLKDNCVLDVFADYIIDFSASYGADFVSENVLEKVTCQLTNTEKLYDVLYLWAESLLFFLDSNIEGSEENVLLFNELLERLKSDEFVDCRDNSDLDDLISRYEKAVNQTDISEGKSLNDDDEMNAVFNKIENDEELDLCDFHMITRCCLTDEVDNNTPQKTKECFQSVLRNHHDCWRRIISECGGFINTLDDEFLESFFCDMGYFDDYFKYLNQTPDSNVIDIQAVRFLRLYCYQSVSILEAINNDQWESEFDDDLRLLGRCISASEGRALDFYKIYYYTVLSKCIESCKDMRNNIRVMNYYEKIVNTSDPFTSVQRYFGIRKARIITAQAERSGEAGLTCCYELIDYLKLLFLEGRNNAANDYIEQLNETIPIIFSNSLDVADEDSMEKWIGFVGTYLSLRQSYGIADEFDSSIIQMCENYYESQFKKYTSIISRKTEFTKARYCLQHYYDFLKDRCNYDEKEAFDKCNGLIGSIGEISDENQYIEGKLNELKMWYMGVIV